MELEEIQNTQFRDTSFGDNNWWYYEGYIDFLKGLDTWEFDIDEPIYHEEHELIYLMGHADAEGDSFDPQAN